MIALACALLGIGLFVYVFAPVREGDLARGENKTRFTFLKERKEVIYDNLRDLNFEYKAGKFPEADFLKMRAELENEAAVVLAEMEDIEAGRTQKT